MTKKQKKMLYRIIISAILFIAALLFSVDIIKKILFAVSYLTAGYDIIIKAVENILRLRIFDENFLMLIASLGAFALSEYPEAVAIALFYQIGELFQSYAVGKSRKSIKALMKIKPDYANIEDNGKIIKTEPENVKNGDIIIINAGEKIPLDGIVEEGSASVDTSAITGESVPLSATVGSRVTSGCICLDGMLRVRVTSEFSESTVSKVLQLVRDAYEKKSKSENFITKFSLFYTPAVVISAAVLGIIIPLLFSVDSALWIKKALAFLVVSCPCALIISVPLSFFGGIGAASKNGILIKGSRYIESLSKAHTVVFDKTGTLTKGEYEVTEIHSKIPENELLRIAAVSEMHSNHPVANALKKAYKKTVTDSQIKDFKEIPGMGVTAEIDGKSVMVGNEKLMESFNINFQKSSQKGTVVYIAQNEEYIGSVFISDTIKPGSEKAVSELKSHGIRKTVMLTGDKKETGEYVGNKVGIDEVYSELLPQDKVEHTEKLKLEIPVKKSLVFVGDGVNDAPVLAFSDVGIAMGAIGSDAAIEASDVVIMDDNPKRIATAIKISKKTMNIAYQNIILSIGIKFLFLILGALGISGLWGAVFADVGVSVIAVLNALRAMKK